MSGQGNIFRIVDDMNINDANKNGITLEGNQIAVKKSKSDGDTGAHEMGHAIGLVHNIFGLMTPVSKDRKRSRNLNKFDIKDIISYPLNNKVNYEFNNDGKKVSAGKGTIINNTNTTNHLLKGGKVNETH